MGWLGLESMKSKIALVAVLAAIGLVLAGATVALGADGTLQKNAAKIVDLGDSYRIKVYDEKGEVVKEAVIPKPMLGKGEITIVMNDEGEIRLGTSKSGEGVGKEIVVNKNITKAVEVANKDSRVLELTGNKGVGLDRGNPVVGVLVNGEHVMLKVLIKGKVYDIVVDLANEVVESIEESKTGNVIEISLATKG